MGKVGLISLFLLLNTYISPLYSANNPSVTFTKENDGTHTFLIDFKFFLSICQTNYLFYCH